MFKKIRRKLKDDSGDAGQFIAIIIAIIIFVMVFLIIASTVKGLSQYITLNTFTDEMSHAAANAGSTKANSVQTRFNELQRSTGITPAIEYNAKYFDVSSGKVQYGDTITLTAYYDANISVFQNVTINLRLKAVKSSKSQQYWKEGG